MVTPVVASVIGLGNRNESQLTRQEVKEMETERVSRLHKVVFKQMKRE